MTQKEPKSFQAKIGPGCGGREGWERKHEQAKTTELEVLTIKKNNNKKGEDNGYDWNEKTEKNDRGKNQHLAYSKRRRGSKKRSEEKRVKTSKVLLGGINTNALSSQNSATLIAGHVKRKMLIRIIEPTDCT